MRFEEVDITKLVLYEKNARKHPKAQIEKIRASIREFGFINPVLIDSKFNVIAGHGRIAAANLEGIAVVPAVFVEHLTPKQQQAYILADNRLALDSEWDMTLLLAEIDSLKSLDFDIDLIGFTAKELCITEVADYSDLEAESEALAGEEDAILPFNVPLKHKEAIVAWLGIEGKPTGIKFGRGLLKKCGLL
jgi:ParB-like chromosome segregation protein Spo0J